MADLTKKEKGSGVGVMLVCMAAMAGMLFLLSWLAHQADPEPKQGGKGKAPAHGAKDGAHKAPPAAKDAPKELAAPDSAAFWLCFLPTLGLALLPAMAALGVGLVMGFLYGMEAALCASYDLTNPLHWLALVVDLTWSLPNTIFGFAIGNPIYLI